MPVFSHLQNSMNQMMACPTFGERMRDYRRELYKREYHPQKLFLKCVSCSTESSRRQTDRPRFLCYKADLATYKQILNVEDLVDAATTTDEAKSSKPEPDILKSR